MEPEVARCPYCGEEILAIAKKCRHCGEWLDTAHIRQRGETTSGYQSGRFDGIQVANVAGPPNVSTPLPSRNKKRWPFLIGLGGGIILIIIGFFVYHFLGRNKMPSVEGKWTVEMDSTGSFDDTETKVRITCRGTTWFRLDKSESEKGTITFSVLYPGYDSPLATLKYEVESKGLWVQDDEKITITENSCDWNFIEGNYDPYVVVKADVEELQDSLERGMIEDIENVPKVEVLTIIDVNYDKNTITVKDDEGGTWIMKKDGQI